MLGPGLDFHATSGLNDGAVVALRVADLALVIAGVPVSLLLIPVFLGIGVKPTYLLALPGIAVVAALFPTREGAIPASSSGTVGALGGAAAFALVPQLLSTWVPGILSDGRLRALAHKSWTQRAAFLVPPSSADGTVGFCSDDFGPAGSLYRPDYAQWVVYLRDTRVEELLAHLDREQVTTVYVSGPLLKRRGMLEEAVRRGRLSPFDRDAWKGNDVAPLQPVTCLCGLGRSRMIRKRHSPAILAERSCLS